MNRIFNILIGVCSIIDGLITILTLGGKHKGLTMDMALCKARYQGEVAAEKNRPIERPNRYYRFEGEDGEYMGMKVINPYDTPNLITNV